jgi:hypothetical protein
MFLRREQRALLEEMQRRSESLANIYMGGLRILADEDNPTHFQLAAHAFRELISHCFELTGAPVVYGDGMKQRLVPVKIAFAEMKRTNVLPPNLTGNSAAVSGCLSDAIQDFLDWAENSRPEARKRAALMLSQLAGSGPALPSDVIAEDISGWMDSDEYFKLVAHHKKTADREEFVGNLFVVENVLLRRLQARPVTDLDEIDALIEEGENAE